MRRSILSVSGSLLGYHHTTPYEAYLFLIPADVEHITESTQNFQKVATRAERGLPGNTVAERLRDAVTTFRATLPVVADLRCPALKERHWQRLHELLGIELSGAEQSITLGELLEQRVMEHAEAVSIIAAEAVQESVLEDMVQKVGSGCCGSLWMHTARLCSCNCCVHCSGA